MAVLVTIMVNSCKHIKCRSCGGVKLKRGYIGVTINEICHGKCLNASKDACECKCKGKFHKGNNSKLLNELLNPKKKKPAVKKAVKKKIEKFEPESIKDEVALFIQRKRFKTSSFDRYSDPNYRKDAKTLALNWLSPKGQSLDQAAQDFLNKYDYNVDSNDIINLITEIIIDYPTGIKQYIKDAKYNQYLREEDEAEQIKQSFYSNTDYNDFDLQQRVQQEDEEYFKNYKEPALVFGTRNMKLKKGSAAAKAFMAKIRAKKGTTKKVGAYKKPKKLTTIKKIGSNLNSVEVIFKNPEYNYTTDVSSSTTEAKAKNYFVGKFFNVGIYPKENLQKCIGIKFNNGKIVSGWKKGNTRFIEKGEKPFKTKKNIIVSRRKVKNPKGTFFDFKTINGLITIKLDKKLASTEYQKTLTYIDNFEKLILKIKNALPTIKTTESKVALKKELAYIKKMLAEYKTHAKELKKLI
jgi:hypothetical protein